MRRTGWLSAALAICMAACGTSNPPVGPGTVTDSGPPPTDDGMGMGDGGVTPMPDNGPPTGDVGTDAGRSAAGSPCTQDSDCIDPNLTCDTTVPGGVCTGACSEMPSAAMERSQCGGTGSTCLTEGDTMPFSQCRRSCTASARTVVAGACPTGYVCTGFWYTHMGGMADATGCSPFCVTDAQCGMGAHCNPRYLGACLGSAPSMAGRVDGQPCDPTVTTMVPGEARPRNTQCRGLCFRTGNAMNQGLCGSAFDSRVTMACPDDPMMTPRGVAGDNLALCVFANCATNDDCARPLVCNAVMGAGGGGVCDYPVDGGIGIPGTGDGGHADAASDATTAVDATAPDATAADAAVDAARTGG